jgi:hypothetical protein
MPLCHTHAAAICRNLGSEGVLSVTQQNTSSMPWAMTSKLRLLHCRYEYTSIKFMLFAAAAAAAAEARNL